MASSWLELFRGYNLLQMAGQHLPDDGVVAGHLDRLLVNRNQHNILSRPRLAGEPLNRVLLSLFVYKPTPVSSL